MWFWAKIWSTLFWKIQFLGPLKIISKKLKFLMNIFIALWQSMLLILTWSTILMSCLTRIIFVLGSHINITRRKSSWSWGSSRYEENSLFFLQHELFNTVLKKQQRIWISNQNKFPQRYPILPLRYKLVPLQKPPTDLLSVRYPLTPLHEVPTDLPSEVPTDPPQWGMHWPQSELTPDPPLRYPLTPL